MYFSTPPNLNDTLFPMWQEIQYSGVRKPECAKARASPKLEYQNTCQKLIAIFFFFTETNIKRLIAIRKNKMTIKIKRNNGLPPTNAKFTVFSQTIYSKCVS
jgi:hypothetical protein